MFPFVRSFRCRYPRLSEGRDCRVIRLNSRRILSFAAFQLYQAPRLHRDSSHNRISSLVREFFSTNKNSAQHILKKYS